MNVEDLQSRDIPLNSQVGHPNSFSMDDANQIPT